MRYYGFDRKRNDLTWDCKEERKNRFYTGFMNSTCEQ